MSIKRPFETNDDAATSVDLRWQRPRKTAEVSALGIDGRNNVWYIPHIVGSDWSAGLWPARRNAGETPALLEEVFMPRFTQGELEVMRILWEHGELKPAEIHARFPRNITNPSLRSYLAILLEKGHLVRRRVGKAYYYKAKTRRESTFRAMLRDLTRVCCDGSVQMLLCQLIRAEKLSESDLLELKRLSEGESKNQEKQ